MTTTVVGMLAPDDAGATPEEVAVGLASDSREALAEAYRRWSSLVYTIARRSLNSHHDAEDVTQQVFVSAWRSRHTLRPGPDALPAWLVGITRRRVADLQLQRMRAARNVEAVAAVAARDPDRSPDDDLPARLMLAHELDRMGEPRASVLRLAVVEDRPYEEIAQRLGLPIGTVKSHVRRGLLHLRSQLEEASRVAP
jgi:RNA polymerase sigma-70 factor (ECF subfamily)